MSQVIKVASFLRATKISGNLIKVNNQDFRWILSKVEKPLVVEAPKGLFSTSSRFLTAYKGFIFFTESKTRIELPPDTDWVLVSKICITL